MLLSQLGNRGRAKPLVSTGGSVGIGNNSHYLDIFRRIGNEGFENVSGKGGGSEIDEIKYHGLT